MYNSLRKSGKVGDSVLQTSKAKVRKSEYMFLQKLIFEPFLEAS